MERNKDDEAFDVLRMILTLGRNNRPYKHLLPRLKELLKDAPAVRLTIDMIRVDRLPDPK